LLFLLLTEGLSAALDIALTREVAHIPGYLADCRNGERRLAMYKYFITLMFCVAFARVSSRIILHSGLIY
jgi:hypothetical protein